MTRHDSQDQSYNQQKRSNYSKISKWTKSKLIRLVTQNNYKVSSAAKVLKINESTSKMIVRKFKKLSQEQKKAFFESAQKEKQSKQKKIQTKKVQDVPQITQTTAPHSYIFVPVFTAMPIHFMQ